MKRTKKALKNFPKVTKVVKFCSNNVVSCTSCCKFVKGADDGWLLTERVITLPIRFPVFDVGANSIQIYRIFYPKTAGKKYFHRNWMKRRPNDGFFSKLTNTVLSNSWTSTWNVKILGIHPVIPKGNFTMLIRICSLVQFIAYSRMIMVDVDCLNRDNLDESGKIHV